jgi:hypothetical protein
LIFSRFSRFSPLTSEEKSWTKKLGERSQKRKVGQKKLDERSWKKKVGRKKSEEKVGQKKLDEKSWTKKLDAEISLF